MDQNKELFTFVAASLVTALIAVSSVALIIIAVRASR